MQFAPGCFWRPYSRPTLLSIFPGSPHGKISENGRFRCPWQICHNSALRALLEPRSGKMFSENGRFRCPWQICHNSALQKMADFWSRGLQQNVLLWLHFKRIPIRRWCNLRQGVFEAPIVPIVGLLCWAFSLGPLWWPSSAYQLGDDAIFAKISENGRFRYPWQICHNSALRALLEPRFAAKCSLMIAL